MNQVGIGTMTPPAAQKWFIEFRDTPDPGSRFPITSRQMSRNPIEGGDVLNFMKGLGYEYAGPLALLEKALLEKALLI